MRLFLIRHGETVDNVAGLYAGVRDSALTVHGVEQARRLGDYFSKNEVKLTHIFSSPLSRALKTAEAVQKLQTANVDQPELKGKSLDIVQVPDLIEQNFGFYEGKPFYARSSPNKSGREAHHEKHKDDPGFVDVESKESMGKRADAFLDEHLLPLLREEVAASSLEVAVVSHGMLLANLWRRMLLRLPRRSLTISPDVTAARGSLVLEHLGGWSNTGYLELVIAKDSPNSVAEKMTREATSAADKPTLPTPIPQTVGAVDAKVSLGEDAAGEIRTSPPPRLEDPTLNGWSTTIVAVDSKHHLAGLKRQRGGIGRIAHDESQKRLDGFFKRQKTS